MVYIKYNQNTKMYVLNIVCSSMFEILCYFQT